MEKFLALPTEKQERIIEAGYQCFGKMGYKKASAQDIAKAAGISKGMIFHYFGSKKGMYLYLIQTSSTEIMDAFHTGFDENVTDYFERFLMVTKCKVSCLKRHPSLLSFFTSLYTETDSELQEDLQALWEQGKQMRSDILFIHSDKEKFKKPEYADLTWKLLAGYGESFVNAAMTFGIDGLGEMQQEFEDCIQMLKQNLYKEEYL